MDDHTFISLYVNGMPTCWIFKFRLVPV